MSDATRIPKSEGEHLADSLSRLDTMWNDHGQTWDLSPNDEFAIGVVLSEIAALRAALASKEQECERLLHMTEIPVGWTTAPTEKWDALREDLAEAVRTRDRFADENDRLAAIVEEVASCGVSMQDERLSYVEVQIDTDTWAEIKSVRAKEANRG